MPAAANPQYDPCPDCGALNMVHRRDCYRCHAPLGTPAKPHVQARPLVDFALDDPAVAEDAANQRRFPRNDVPRHMVEMEGEGIPLHGAVLRNISASGIGVLTALPCTIGADVRIHVEIDGTLYRVDGVVRHISESRDGLRTMFLVGIQNIGSTPPLTRLMYRRPF